MLEGGWVPRKPEKNGTGVGSAERDVTPKLNLWYEFSNCCCHVDRSILHLSFTKKINTALPYLFTYSYSLPGSATPRVRYSQGPPLPGPAPPRVRHSQGPPLYAHPNISLPVSIFHNLKTERT